jgi:transcriptional regulator with PAS, ATPase and Fis domain
MPRAPCSEYYWPGHVRELEHVIEHVVTLSPSPDLRIPRAALNLKAGGVNGSTTLEAAERQRMLRVLQASRSGVGSPLGAAAR